MIKLFSFAMAFVCFVLALIFATNGMWWRTGVMIFVAALYVMTGLDELDRE